MQSEQFLSETKSSLS